MTRKIRYRNVGAISRIQDLNEAKEALKDLLYLNSKFRTRVTADYTTTGAVSEEKVLCDNTTAITVTLHTPAEDGQVVKVKRKGTGAVTIATGGSETIDGSPTMVLSNQYDGPSLEFDEEDQEWGLE